MRRTGSCGAASGPVPPRRPGPSARPPPPRPRALAALLLAGLALAAAATPLSGQLRRAADVPYVPDDEGRLLVGLGAGTSWDAEFPLSGLRGDLHRLGDAAVAYSFAPGAVVRVRADLVRVLEIEARGPSAVPLDDDVDDGTTRDAGDVRVGTLFRLAGDARGLSGGLHLEAILPSSDERKGIGTNTTDVAASLFGSWARGTVRITGDLGMAILEAPTEPFVQDDVVVYAAEALWRPGRAPERLGLALSARGRANTRGRVPLGNEDRGRLRLQAEWRSGGWRVDAGVTRGYAGTSADWGVEAGVALVLEP